VDVEAAVDLPADLPQSALSPPQEEAAAEAGYFREPSPA